MAFFCCADFGLNGVESTVGDDDGDVAAAGVDGCAGDADADGEGVGVG